MNCLRYPLYLSTTIAFENHLCAEHSQFKKSVSQSKESNIDTIADYVAAWYVHQKLIMKSVLRAYGYVIYYQEHRSRPKRATNYKWNIING